MVYYESRNGEPEKRRKNEDRCDERLNTKAEEATCLACTLDSIESRLRGDSGEGLRPNLILPILKVFVFFLRKMLKNEASRGMVLSCQ